MSFALLGQPQMQLQQQQNAAAQFKLPESVESLTRTLKQFEECKKYIDRYRYILLLEYYTQQEKLKNLKTKLDEASYKKSEYDLSKSFTVLKRLKDGNEELTMRVLSVQHRMEYEAYRRGQVDRKPEQENIVHQSLKESIRLLEDNRSRVQALYQKMEQYDNKKKLSQRELSESGEDLVEDVSEHNANVFEHLKALKEAIVVLHNKIETEDREIKTIENYIAENML